VRTAGVSGTGDDVGAAVAVEIRRRDANAAAKARVEGEEVGEHAAIGAAEDADVRATAFAGPGDYVWTAVAVHIAGGHEHTAGKTRVVGVEAG
jgi:hypothetical protein